MEALRAVVQPCRLRTCPQTPQEGGRRRRQGRVGVCPRRTGQAPDQHFPGPVPVPEDSWHVCTVCRHKWQTDLGVCFVSSPFVFLWYSGGSYAHLNSGERPENMHEHMHAAQRMKAFHQCPLPPLHLQRWVRKWSLNTTRQMTAGHFTYSFITSHWFIPVYLFNSLKKSFPWIVVLLKVSMVEDFEKLQGQRIKIP